MVPGMSYVWWINNNIYEWKLAWVSKESILCHEAAILHQSRISWIRWLGKVNVTLNYSLELIEKYE